MAADIEVEFEDALADGLDPLAAGRRVLNDAPGLDDDEDAAVTYLALSALQLEHGVIDDTVRSRALESIGSGWAISRWEGSGPEQIAARARILERFQRILEERAADLDTLHELTNPEVDAS